MRGIRENMATKMGDDSDMPMGTGVWLDADGVHLIVSSIRTQCFCADSAFTDLGLDITAIAGD